MYLGLDYGRAHIGVSFAERDLATPLATIENTSRAEVLAKLRHLIDKYQVDHIVAGVPEGELKPEIEAFATEVSNVLNVPVHLHPETLSSQDAVAKLRESGASRKKLQNDHAYAAVLILEDYLEAKSSVN